MSDSLWPPWTAACQASLSITNSQSLFRLMSIESVMPSNNLILCHPLLFLPSIFPSITVFSNESALRIMWPKYWSFSFSISPSNDCWALISFVWVLSHVWLFAPMDCSPPSFFVHGILQARILEWVAISFSRGWFPLGWTGWIFLQSKRLSSPTPQFKSINSSVLSFIHSQTFTSIHDYWKNHSFD